LNEMEGQKGSSVHPQVNLVTRSHLTFEWLFLRTSPASQSFNLYYEQITTLYSTESTVYRSDIRKCKGNVERGSYSCRLSTRVHGIPSVYVLDSSLARLVAI